MKLGYSEFSFGYAFTENLIRSSATAPSGAPVFPNLVEEGRLGYDVHIDLPGYPLYLQYKLPELMVRNTATEISKHILPGIVTPFFRMYLMKKSVSKQHDLLMELEDLNPNCVYYASPALRCSQSFNAAYDCAMVHQRSVLLSPIDIGPLPDDSPHVVSYRDGASHAWFCSEPREIRAFRFEDISGQMRELVEDQRYRRLREVARTTCEELMELVPAQVRNNESMIRQRIREKWSLFADRTEAVEATMDVVEDLLVSREIARVALGVEFLVAQRSE